MKAGAAEVETGAELAEQAAGALQEIREAAAARNTVLNDMMSSVVEIRSLSADVVRATDGISEIAAETNDTQAQNPVRRIFSSLSASWCTLAAPATNFSVA